MLGEHGVAAYVRTEMNRTQDFVFYDEDFFFLTDDGRILLIESNCGDVYNIEMTNPDICYNIEEATDYINIQLSYYKPEFVVKKNH